MNPQLDDLELDIATNIQNILARVRAAPATGS